MFPRSRFRHSSVTLEVFRLSFAAVFGLIAVGFALAAVGVVAVAAVVAAAGWLAREGWRRWHASM